MPSHKLLNKALAIATALLCIPPIYYYATGQWQSEKIIQFAKQKDKIQPNNEFIKNSNYLPYLSANAVVYLSETHNPINEKLRLQALKRNPSNGRLAAYILNQGHGKQHLAELASKLWPSHSYVRTATANFWLSQKQIDKALKEWDVLLTKNVNSKSIFTALSKFPEYSDGLQLLKPYIEKPPTWWDRYFTHLSKNAQLSTVYNIYQQRLESATPISNKERQQFISRLLKEKHWSLAYTTWLSGLNIEKLKYRHFIYDGGFEDTLFNTPFTWNIKPAKNFQASLVQREGTVGNNSLMITFFKGKRIKFNHLYQTLLLKPGNYMMSLRYRVDQFQTNKGLNWRIRCNNKSLIAESHTFKQQTLSWKTTKLNFHIPSDCPTQILRLEANSTYAHDHLFDGSIWFDDLKITRNHD